MPKHPVPKRRSSHTRAARRSATNETRTLKKLTKMSQTVPCPKCQQPRSPHTMCPTCGTYRGRTVIDFTVQDAKVEKVKA